MLLRFQPLRECWRVILSMMQEHGLALLSESDRCNHDVEMVCGSGRPYAEVQISLNHNASSFKAMTLKKWEPLRELDDLFDRSRRTLGLAPWHSREWLGERDWSPRVDIGETDNTFVIKAEIPGVKKEDVKVSVQNGVLMLDGERSDETSEQGLHFHRVERFHGSFNRSFTLPPSVDPNQVKANFNEGVLTISLAKLPGSESAAREVLVE